jgi:hypothetical protein
VKKHFIIVGAQRGGTTYLYNILNEHPEICMSQPVKPEPKYFMNKSVDEVDLTQYFESFFVHCSESNKVTGEKSTSYYEREDSAKLISSALPETNIVFLLRNPIKRALSNFFFSSNNGLEIRTLEEVFVDMVKAPKNSKDTSVNPFDYLGRGDYAKFIKMYMKYFPLNQIKIVIFEELVGNRDNIQELYSFLDVNNSFVPKSKNEVVNHSSKPSRVSAEIITSLTEYYKPYISELEILIQKEIPAWK